MLRVLLAVDTDRSIAGMRDALQRAGYDVIAEVASARALLRAVETERPDVVIIDTESPARDTLEQLAAMNSAAPRPVVMFSGTGNAAIIRAAVSAGVTAYVVDGLAPERLAPILEVARARFDEESRLRQRLADAEQRLADRKLIERAKGIVMARRGLTEDAAFELMRNKAMQQGLTIADIARQLIAVSDLLS
ncbi:ANTAR domain-containing protein [Robbsia sp. Bb-Pol-6]|uniref:ANTAR domain-containing protein n=1 Tax=Robbsia betulipollinis TaxID=2981849 RepID=A0ABT3ZTN0_9BURK|nr:ANTAR domain-containing protein [Robbsia betulipollinis]MCY0389223.1 ANTAR domain-containing protein [Robbsia betulipollinis]